mmetsp:Transcript_17833/g.39025  ORF Transcript_17833/g.39025 Transcript_17833/m.39025 type:complete len:90 (-) Transcript_17833:710-979(-)
MISKWTGRTCSPIRYRYLDVGCCCERSTFSINLPIENNEQERRSIFVPDKISRDENKARGIANQIVLCAGKTNGKLLLSQPYPCMCFQY